MGLWEVVMIAGFLSNCKREKVEVVVGTAMAPMAMDIEWTRQLTHLHTASGSRIYIKL